MKPFRLMIGSRDIVDRRELVDRVRLAESIGFSHLCIHDHLARQLAPIPLLSVVATATERLRLCPLVFNNDLRHPAVLAQDLASLDILSEGRLVVGLGAGWNEPEYRASGLQFDPPGTRIERLGEAIAVMRGLFADAPLTFRGRHFTITDMDGQPKPVQRPHPPFLVAVPASGWFASLRARATWWDSTCGRTETPSSMPFRLGWTSGSAGFAMRRVTGSQRSS